MWFSRIPNSLPKETKICLSKVQKCAKSSVQCYSPHVTMSINVQFPTFQHRKLLVAKMPLNQPLGLTETLRASSREAVSAAFKFSGAHPTNTQAYDTAICVPYKIKSNQLMFLCFHLFLSFVLKGSCVSLQFLSRVFHCLFEAAFLWRSIGHDSRDLDSSNNSKAEVNSSQTDRKC